ncbi:ATP-binding cassette domain-containing protein [Embleya sp. NPDC005575]|uniref:ABC transporter ATP-binding protein n=1 Tax=Embleya sp. NPDC005575 TaxID=3156892 RepID=UPI0033A71C94
MTTDVTPHDATPLIEVSGLRKTYRTGTTEVVAVEDLSFSLPVGGALGLVGESGSGKTTTARMLLGLERPDAGRIVVRGTPLAESVRGRAARLARAKAVQMVFQDPYLSLDGRLSIGATLDGVLRLHGVRDPAARTARIGELLAQVGLGPREAATRPRGLSGGQRQRAAIARALAVEPALLVLDEAVSALDVSVQAQVLNLLADIRRDTGIGLIFVSHDLAVVRYLCDEALVLHRGRTVEHRPVGDLLAAPADPYTRLLLASIPRPGWDPEHIARQRRDLTAPAAAGGVVPSE